MENLFTVFDPTDTASWKSRLEKDLKGITFEQLATTDRNGITVYPFYTQENAHGASPVPGAYGDWAIVAQIDVTDARQANSEALIELQNGASGLCFSLQKEVDLHDLLKDIELPYIYAHFQVGNSDITRFTASLHQYFDEKGWDRQLRNCFVSAETQFNQPVLSYQVIADGRMLLNAGASATYELGCIIAMVQEQLHIHHERATIKNVNVLHISLSTDTVFFEQIAKLRALRLLLLILAEQYDINPIIHIHAETADYYRAPFDRYNNLLRDSIAGMAAVAGGCDSLYIHPFDQFVDQEKDREFSRRMGRNQQLIFKEESYLDKVADVAAGSYYIETLTRQFKEEAWKHFLNIETSGGFCAACRNKIIQAQVSQQRADLIDAYKSGKRVLVGVNKYPDNEDMPIHASSSLVQNENAFPLLKLWEEIL